MCLSSFYRLPDRTRIELDQNIMGYSAQNSKQYGNDYEYNTDRQQFSYKQLAKIFVVNGDCLDTVLYLKKKYPTSNPVVLNMANAHSPGGGWRNGLYFSVWFFLII